MRGWVEEVSGVPQRFYTRYVCERREWVGGKGEKSEGEVGRDGYGMVWYGMVWYGMVWYDMRGFCACLDLMMR